MTVRWIVFIIIYILIDMYAFQAVKTLTRNVWVHGLYVALSVLVLAALIYLFSFGSPRLMESPKMYIIGVFLAVFVPKLLLVVFMFTEDVVRIFVAGIFKIFGEDTGFYIPSRRKFVSTVALGIAAVPFVSFLYGMYAGRYNYKVLKYTLEFEDLPEAFNGYTITQLSDIHSGSFDNKEKVAYAVTLANEQESDMILFTGDLVNNTADEMNEWKDIFSTLKAKDGVFSVLGNHDYGDYVTWNSVEEKQQNLRRLKEIQKEMGWDLLLNENRLITRNEDRIVLVGVENWGVGGFKKAGDLDRATAGVATNDFKILMSHDPSHWQEQVKEDERHFHLTLSGHTHGMQFGIEIPGWFKWSPVKYRYEHWAGIYEESGRYINVNRGFGFLGYPGRVGIWPEITVIQLKKKRTTV